MTTLAPQLLNRATRRAVRKWKFSLHDSLLTLTSLPTLDATNRIRWLHKARGRRLELILDKPGSLSLNVPTNSIEGHDIFGQEIVRCIVGHGEDKNGIFQPIWSGPIYTAEADEPGGKINVTCVGWEELLGHRELREDVNFYKMSNPELAQAIINIANNQYANDGYGLGAAAEDLLYGNGNFENTAAWDASGETWTAIGQINQGIPLLQNDTWWQDVPPSGSHWFRTNLTGTNVIARVWLASRAGLQVENRNVGFPVEPGQIYTIDGIRRGTQRTQGSGVSISGAECAIQVRWYSAGGVIISTSEPFNLRSEALLAWSENVPITMQVTAPDTAALGAIVVVARTGTQRVVTTTSAAGTIDMLWDNIIMTKASNSGKRNFPLRMTTSVTKPYIVNAFTDASFEAGLGASGVWTTFPPAVNKQQSIEWASTGKNSLKTYLVPTTTTGEHGVKALANGPQVTPGPLYYRVNVKVLYPGTNGTQARLRRVLFSDQSTIESWTSEIFYGAGEHTFEIYVPSAAIFTGGQVLYVEVFTNAISNETITFYIDDITYAQEHPPVPFYEGSQQSARYWNGNGQASMGPVFTRTYTQGTKLNQILTEMTEVEWGIDYRINPTTRRLELYWDVLIPGTSLRGRGVDRSNVVFGYKTEPYNVADITENHDASRLNNRVNTQGKVGRGLAQDFDSINKYGIHESTIALTDVVDPSPPQPSILAVYAGSEVAMFSKPYKLYTFKPRRYVPGDTVPMFGVDYDIGDLARLRSNGDVIKVGVPGAEQDDSPPITTLIDNFQRTSGQPVEAGNGSSIWATTGFTTAANNLAIATPALIPNERYAQAEIAGGNAALKGLWGPDWDFYWYRPVVNTNCSVDFYWGNAGVGGVLGTNYHRMQILSDGTSFGPGDFINIDGVNVIQAPMRFLDTVWTWFSKRGDNYRIFERTTENDPWQLMASLKIAKKSFDDVPHTIGLGLNTTAGTSWPFDNLSGGTFLSDAQKTGSTGQVVRIFGATITIDDNSDGESVDSLTTALS